MRETPRLKLFVLGAFRLEREGTPLKLATRKMESLFAYLALHPQEHTREKLAALFWGDSTDKSARHSLSVALNTLRKNVSPDLWLADRETVQLNPDLEIWADAREFKDESKRMKDEGIADNTLSLNSGEANHPSALRSVEYADLLADFYDDWILQEREQYRDAYLDVLLAMVQQSREKSDYTRAIEYAQRVVEIDRANERAHQHLMFCFAVTGEREKALEQYEKCRRALHEELALDTPLPETVALYDWIRQTKSTPLLAARLTNLPLPLTSFIGRTRELQELKETMQRVRFVTLTGAGGSGKTRFAIQAGLELLDLFRDGVWWLDLAPLTDPARVAETLLRALGLRAAPDQTPEEFLLEALRRQERLLIFDNCEHVLDASARRIELLLRACPGVKILATSREPLNLRGEVVYLVPTLPFPHPGSLSVAHLLMQYEAIRLFVERAQAVQPQFLLNEQNAYAVAQICARLDGIPLALELAAACIHSLSASEIAARLDDRFQLLTRGERTALPRQQTLYALIDWSYNLLTEPERELFQHLAIFAGGFTLQAVEYISAEVRGLRTEAGSFAVTQSLLSRLVEKSLVVVTTRGETTRYAMLESILAFAREKLRAKPDYKQVQERHFDFFLKQAHQADAHGLEGNESLFLAGLELEIDNVRAALAWSLDRQGLNAGEADARADNGLDLFTALWAFWINHGSVDEAREWLDKLLKAHNEPTPTRSRGFILGATLARMRGDADGAASFAGQALESATALGDPLRIAWAWMEIASTESDRGHSAGALAALDRALETFQTLNEPIWLNRTRFLSAELRTAHGDLDSAQAMWEQGLEWFRAQSDLAHVGWGLDGLATILRLRGDLEQAAELAQEALTLKYRAMDRYGLGFAFDVLAQVIAAQGHYERAAGLWGVTDGLRQTQGVHLTPFQQRLYRSLVPITLDALGQARFDAATTFGRSLSLENAVAFASQGKLQDV